MSTSRKTLKYIMNDIYPSDTREPNKVIQAKQQIKRILSRMFDCKVVLFNRPYTVMGCMVFPNKIIRFYFGDLRIKEFCYIQPANHLKDTTQEQIIVSRYDLDNDLQYEVQKLLGSTL